MPSLTWKMEYRKAIYERYRKAGKEQKGRILAEFIKNCGYNRKYAIWLLNRPWEEVQKKPSPRKRRFHYSTRAIDIAEVIWKAAGYPCGARLKETIPLWLPAARRRLSLTDGIEEELSRISARQLDNRLRSRKRQLKKKIYSTTKPGYLLKSMIPIRTSNWDIKRPGFLEIDLVAHCGNSNEGQFVYTLNATDIHTGWVERVAVMGKGQTGILNGIFDIRNNLPMGLKGIDSDNGDEFINYQMLDFCRKSRPSIQFTRGRAYKKNDNAYIEQKNRTHVRQVLGWDRYETPQALEAVNDLYANELRLLQNFFQPSMKLVKKTHIGSKIVRKYDAPKTPLQRVLESGQYHRGKAKKLKAMLASLDPFELSQAVDKKLEGIYKLASQRVRPPNDIEPLVKQAASPWRKFHFGKRQVREHRILRRLKRELALSA